MEDVYVSSVARTALLGVKGEKRTWREGKGEGGREGEGERETYEQVPTL